MLTFHSSVCGTHMRAISSRVSKLSILYNAIGNYIFEIAATCPRSQCVKTVIHFTFTSTVSSGLLFSNTPFIQRLRPLCLPCATTKLARSPLKTQRRPKYCLGRQRVAQRTFIHVLYHGRHGRREVLSMFKTVTQRLPRRSVAHRSLKGGRGEGTRITVVAEWTHRGQPLVAP